MFRGRKFPLNLFKYAMNVFVILLLVSFSGLFSGLNLGLLSLNKVELERKMKLGNKDAIKVYPIREKGNLLLCTLLLGNVAVNSALSIYMADISTGLIGGLLSTSLIVIFGEILPQSFISRYALKVGTMTASITRILIALFYPLAFPIAILLDKILGDELPTIWSKEELQEIIKDHEDHPDSLIDENEERIIIGALKFSNLTAKEIMTPAAKVFALPLKTNLDDDTIYNIKNSRHTRIPIFKDSLNNIVGILYTHDLIGLKSQEPVNNLMRKENVIKIKSNEKLDNIFNKLIDTRMHLSCVFSSKGNFLGLVSLEDVFEEIIQEEVFDEHDKVRQEN